MADGNCAFNAVAQGICYLIRNEKNDENEVLTKLLAGLTEKESLQLPDLKSKSKQTLREKLLSLPPEEQQKILSPILRRMAITKIREQKDDYRDLYLNRLKEAYDSYISTKQQDDLFTVHYFILDKFKTLKEQKNSSNGDDLTEDFLQLTDWWNTEGFENYLNILSQPANGPGDHQHWGGDLEIDVLGKLFNLNIHYQKNDNPKRTLGVFSGLIPENISNEAKKLLKNVGLLDKDNNYLYLETIEQLSPYFTPIGQQKWPAIQRWLNKHSDNPVFPKQIDDIDNMAELCTELVARNVLIEDDKPANTWRWISNELFDEGSNKTLIQVRTEDVRLRCHGISKEDQNLLTNTLKKAKEIKQFAIKHEGVHWSCMATTNSVLDGLDEKLEFERKQRILEQKRRIELEERLKKVEEQQQQSPPTTNTGFQGKINYALENQYQFRIERQSALVFSVTLKNPTETDDDLLTLGQKLKEIMQQIRTDLKSASIQATCQPNWQQYRLTITSKNLREANQIGAILKKAGGKNLVANNLSQNLFYQQKDNKDLEEKALSIDCIQQ